MDLDLDLGPREGKRLTRRSLWPASPEIATVGMEKMKRPDKRKSHWSSEQIGGGYE